MDAVLCVAVFCNTCDVVFIGYELCVFVRSRYVWGVYVEECVFLVERQF